jgi:hypothetical protein
MLLLVGKPVADFFDCGLNLRHLGDSSKEREFCGALQEFSGRNPKEFSLLLRRRFGKGIIQNLGI